MIDPSTLTVIGRIVKTHGLAGEVTAVIDVDIDFSKGDCIILDIDGIYVPFFIESARQRGAGSSLISVEGISSQEEALEIVGHDIFISRDSLAGDEADDILYVSDMVGFTLFDASNGIAIGKITEIDDSTENILFTIETGDGREVFIPFSEELVADVDPENRSLTLAIADGLLDL